MIALSRLWLDIIRLFTFQPRSHPAKPRHGIRREDC